MSQSAEDKQKAVQNYEKKRKLIQLKTALPTNQETNEEND